MRRWETEGMGNHPDYLIQALGDLVWKDKRECQVVAQRVAEYLQLDTVASQGYRMRDRLPYCSRKGLIGF
jgi:hypothetical protein